MAIGVPRPLALEKPQAVDLAQAARYFGAHGEPDAATLALLQKCAVPLLAAAMPRAVWLLADTPALTDAGLLPGEDVHKHLKGCGQPHRQRQHLRRFCPQAGGQRLHAGADHHSRYRKLQARLCALRCADRAGRRPAGRAAGAQRNAGL